MHKTQHTILCSNHTILAVEWNYTIYGALPSVYPKKLLILYDHIYSIQSDAVAVSDMCVWGQQENTVKLTRVAQSQQFQM